MKYIYGPVESRRLGLSLGLSLIPYKTCDFDCIYCQLGKTKEAVLERKEYVPLTEVLSELKAWLREHPDEAGRLNYLTFSGAGEPTLNIEIERLILEIKKITAIPLAVITNASLLHDSLVRKAVRGADLIVPSLDAVSLAIFQKVNRPHPAIKIEEIIDGLVAFRKEYKGKIWLEVMLVAGVNDDLRQIKKLKEVIEKINPDKVQLNSPLRTPAERDIFPVDKKKLEKIKEILEEKCEII